MSLRKRWGPKTHRKTRCRGAMKSNTPFPSTNAAKRSSALLVHTVCSSYGLASLARLYPLAYLPNRFLWHAILTLTRLRPKIGARCLYSPSCREGVFSETPYKIALPTFYFTAVTVRRCTTSVDGVQNSSLPTQASKASRSRQRVMTRTSSSPSGACSERSTSIETKPGNPCTFPRLFANRSTICPAAPSFTGRRLTTTIIQNLSFPSPLRYPDRLYSPSHRLPQ